MLAFMIVLLVLGIAGLGSFFYIRKVLREQKSFERGLKMVPLLIHLPPLSDDIDSGSRDERDVVDENTSKAQVIYNILASTLQKGAKSNFYGQRHVSVEIIGTGGTVHFYIAVPVNMVSVVEQAVLSAYPTARLEEVAEHNIFSAVGKISGTVGGELSLKANYAYPIATYQDIKRDSMQALLNALSKLDKEDGVGIQILFRPAPLKWRKKSRNFAAKKRKHKDMNKSSGSGMGVFDLLSAFSKPLEDKSGASSTKSELSATDQAILDAIDAKAQQPGFEVAIRIVCSSNILQRSQSLLHNIVATFSLYDAPSKNGFKFSPARDIDQFVTAFILRFFPREANKNVLNSTELSTLFHFPDQENIPTSQLSRQDSKQVDGPRNVPDEGLLLGYNVFRGIKKPIRVALNDRRRHMYAVGQTGTGKSTFLENLALQDMLNGDGFAFVDPHGDSVEKLLALVPKERTEDIVYFCPAEMDYPLGLNIFEYDNPEQKDFLIQEAINMLTKLYDPQQQGIVGPRFEHMFRNAAQALMADPAGSTFIDIPKMFIDPDFVKQKLQFVTDQTVLDFWQKEFPSSQRSNDSGEVVSWIVSKFGAFLSNTMMRNIIGQTKSAFNLREIMDNKKILLVNLSKGRTGDLNSRLLGMIFVMRFQAAAMSRASIPEDDRKDFCLYVDEFQNFSTDSFATIMSEARKYRLNLIVANQFTTQLSDEIREAVFGNMGSIVAFRIGQNDTEALTKYFQPMFDASDLLRVPNYNAVVRTMIGGIPTQPFSMTALPALGNPNKQLGDALKQLSAAKYGRPRGQVEAEIFKRLAVVEKPKPVAPSGFAPSSGSLGGAPAASSPKPSSGSSFLDDWLNKKKTAVPAGAPLNKPTSPPAAQSVSPLSTNPTPQPSPVPSPPTPQSPAPVSVDEGGNISSNTLVREEVSSIAQQLKKDIGANKVSADPDARTETKEDDVLSHGDTIHIDKEGNLTDTSQ